MNIDLIPLISFAIITTFTPGPNNISSASMGVMLGYRKTLRYLLGITCGFFGVMIACAFLASHLLAVLPAAESYLRWLGAAYITWLATGLLKANYAFTDCDPPANAFVRGLILQLLNPKVTVYGLTLYSTFLAAISGRWVLLVLSAAAFAVTAVAATSTWALCGAAIATKLRNRRFKTAINAALAMLLFYSAMELAGLLG